MSTFFMFAFSKTLAPGYASSTSLLELINILLLICSTTRVSCVVRAYALSYQFETVVSFANVYLFHLFEPRLIVRTNK